MGGRRHFHSIRTKVTLITLAAIVISVTIIGAFSILAIKREGDSDTSRQMKLICDSSTKSINELLQGVEQSVSMVSRFAVEDLDARLLAEGGIPGGNSIAQAEEGRRQAMGRLFAANVNLVRPLFHSVANHAPDVMSFYYRVNPELTERPEGFFYVRREDGDFGEEPMTDLSAYNPEDVIHVGWYYIPREAGEPVWLDPYNNANLGEAMISYVVPIFKEEVFIGIIGMDIGYQTLMEQISLIKLFETGYAYLVKGNGEIVYHPTLETGDMHDRFSPELSTAVEDFSEMDSSGESTISYTYQGQRREMAFNTLKNGLKLVVVAPEREISAGWHRLVNAIALIAVFIMAVFAVITHISMGRITTPLKRLTEASRQVIAGNYDVDLSYHRDDEVGVLTEAFSKLTAHLKAYIDDLNGRVNRDALTGVKNKGAFDIYARELDDAIAKQEPGKRVEFAIVMFDCNELKEINDRYGHDKGDLYLKKTCQLICDTFAHSPVFRLGGDEFVAILQREDFTWRKQRLKDFDANAAAITDAARNPWDRLSVAKGMAVYDPGQDADAGAVLARADAAMYVEKRAYKAKHGE